MEIKRIDQSQATLVNQLVSDAFHYHHPHTFFDDFPVWASSQVLRLGLFEGNELISHVGVRLVGEYALLGAVATKETHRAQGLSTKLITEALRIIDEQNCSWTFLWGSEHEFYGKFGFTLSGIQARGALSKLSLDPKSIVTKEIKTGFSEAIFQFLLKMKNTPALKESDREWLIQHKTVKWFSLENPFAFVGFERGMDLKHMVHEMGGDQKNLEKILYAIYESDPQAEVMGPVEQLKKIGFDEASIIKEYLCLARPKNSQQKWNPDFWISGISAC